MPRPPGHRPPRPRHLGRHEHPEPPVRLWRALKQSPHLLSAAAAVAGRVALELNAGDQLHRLTAAERRWA